MHKVRVLEIFQETEDVKTFRCEKPPGFEFKPGQFVFIHLGQINRAYSLASSPERPYLEFTIKLAPSGALSPFFHKNTKSGDEFLISGPAGKFTFSDDYQEVVLIAGGTGIAPMRSMMQHILDKKLKTKVTVLHSLKSPSHLIFRDEWDQYRNNFNVILTMTQDPGHTGLKGRITKQLLEKTLSKGMYFLCGPAEMLKSIIAQLVDLGVSRKNIKIDAWG